MSIKGNWPRENCTLLDKICWLYLGDLPEKMCARAMISTRARSVGKAFSRGRLSR